MGETSNASPDAPASPDPEPVTIEAPASPDDLPQIPITEIQPQQIPWFPTDEGTEAHIQPVPLTQVDMSSGDTIRNVAKPSKKPLDHDRIADGKGMQAMETSWLQAVEKKSDSGLNRMNQSQDDEEEGEIHSDDDSGEDNSTMNNPNQPMPRDNELKTSEHFRPPKDRVDLRPPRSVRL
uniref:Similar to n=1 Tax=Heterorhabditis bacteriophora TaxID=37862 RepID=A0A1I7W7U2_HETBA